MKSKLAIWSWILPVFYFITIFTLPYLRPSEVSYPAEGGMTIKYTSPAFDAIFHSLFFALFMLSIVITGLVFGIVSLKKINQNPNLTGKGQAIVGIILNAIMILLGLQLLLSGLAA